MLSVNAYKIRRKVEAEGFACPWSDDIAVKIAYGLRTAPVICLAWTVTGTVMASPITLWTLAIFATLGAILPTHPFDVFYNFGWRHLVGAPVLPAYPFRRRLVCLTAMVMLISAGWAFQAGLPIAGYTIGVLLASVSLVYITTGFCTLSFLLRPRAYWHHISQ